MTKRTPAIAEVSVRRPSLPLFKFLEQAEGDVVTAKQQLVTATSPLELATLIKNHFVKMGLAARIRSYENDWVCVEGDGKLISIVQFGNDDDEEYRPSAANKPILNIAASVLGIYTITLSGAPDAVQSVVEMLNGAFKHKRHAAVKWWYDTGHGPNYQTTFLDDPKLNLRPEFYPNLQESPDEYIDQFLKAPEAVLLMCGAPGTGKTSFLRHMVHSRSLSAMVVFDEALMKNDRVFQSFLFNPDNDVLIIEDADTILVDRELEGNKLMSRFLNISDGLIKLPNKKLVFTTNLTDFNKVDQALMRPGRCFDVMHTRPLNLDEAQKACKVAGLAVPVERREYTIAELFNQGKIAKARRIGFVA